MPDRVPFYKASKLEKFKILKISMICTTLSIVTCILIFLIVGDGWPQNHVGWMFLSTVSVGLCCGIGWYSDKYSKLGALGGIIGFLAGLINVLAFTDGDLLFRIAMAVIAGIVGMGVGSFVVWIPHDFHSYD